jgi:hypothetical protein
LCFLTLFSTIFPPEGAFQGVSARRRRASTGSSVADSTTLARFPKEAVRSAVESVNFLPSAPLLTRKLSKGSPLLEGLGRILSIE